MGKFDGMDAKLVRDLLAEAKHAAAEMRKVEDQVRLTMNRAGLSTQTTHRPAQIADAVDTMIKDVNVRLGVLEKRADPPGMGAGASDDPKGVRGDRERYENPRADDKTDDVPPKTGDAPPKTGDTPPKTADDPPKTGDDPPRRGDSPPKTGDDPKRGDAPKTDQDRGGGKGDTDVPKGEEAPKSDDFPKGDDGKTCEEPRTGDQPRTGDSARTGSEPRTGDQPRTGDDSRTGDQPRGDDGSGTDPGGNVCDDDKGTGQDTGTDRDSGADQDARTGDQPVGMPKDDEVDSRRDRGAEAETGTRDDPSDTPAQDTHDVNKPQVVEVDGVKVLQVPLDPPTAEQLEDLLENTDKVAPAEMPRLPADTTTASDVNAWANDGSEVVSAGTTPPGQDALKTVVEHHRDIRPLDMPGVEVPAGEYGKGAWAERDIRPDGPAGSIDPSRPSTGDATTPPSSDSTGGEDGTCAPGTDEQPGGTGRTPGDTTPGDGGTTPSRPAGDEPGQGTRDGQDPGDREAGNQDDRGAGDRGAGDREGGDTGDQETGDQGTGRRGEQGEPVRIPPTNPSVDPPDGNSNGTSSTAAVADPDPGGATGRGDGMATVYGADPRQAGGTGPAYAVQIAYGTEPAYGGESSRAEPVYGGESPRAEPAYSGDPSRTDPADGSGSGQRDGGGGRVGTGGGSDVVSVNVTPPDLDALRTVIEHHRDIQPVDMPSVEVPPGEYGEGRWAPEDIRPDGPSGSVDSGTPERSA
ncbi:hypothetical protein [Nonomuraea diastatica]|uniref:Uncharacterized protein n=1 Tax=Nonomuraea diastatica TaxID=1848329 RepID=A0A4R4VT38_9ACTN|nr:hypothetical protein [Nonomuraea diastatica]TDD09149.1 hypothetical protein E1294_47015 [Nonomuraea diastatica]